MLQTPAGTATVYSWHCKLPDNTGQQHGSTTPALLNGSTGGVRGVGPIQLATRRLVSVGNNQQSCKLFSERKTYIPGLFARNGLPFGNFILLLLLLQIRTQPHLGCCLAAATATSMDHTMWYHVTCNELSHTLYVTLHKWRELVTSGCYPKRCCWLRARDFGHFLPRCAAGWRMPLPCHSSGRTGMPTSTLLHTPSGDGSPPNGEGPKPPPKAAGSASSFAQMLSHSRWLACWSRSGY
jgi:hypothetical protein